MAHPNIPDSSEAPPICCGGQGGDLLFGAPALQTTGLVVFVLNPATGDFEKPFFFFLFRVSEYVQLILIPPIASRSPGLRGRRDGHVECYERFEWAVPGVVNWVRMYHVLLS